MNGFIDVSEGLAGLDAALQAIPNIPAVFLLWPKEGEPYLGRTTMLRRRLLRLLREREKSSRLLNLRHTARRIEYWFTGSRLEASARLYELARAHFPGSYAEHIRLRLPPYVKLLLHNPFPRTQITTHLTRNGLFYGPFRSRTSAERFEAQFLDLFQIRRCQEDLAPSPSHPGCIYGEMSMCLRPCQQVVGPDEYGHEVERVRAFLSTSGASLLETLAATRERFSEEMNFEEAARQHKRIEKVQQVLQLRDELAGDLDALTGAAVAPSALRNAVEVWLLRQGHWQGAVRIDFKIVEGKPVSLDQKLQDTLTTQIHRPLRPGERQEYLALFSRWYYSSWRDGEWIPFPSLEQIPYRKLVNAISRVAKRDTPPVPVS